MSSIEKITEGFPFPRIPPIVGQPCYETIAELQLQLNANAASVQSNLGCGQFGHLWLTVQPAVYATISEVEFIPPVNPGGTPIIPDLSTGAQIASIRYTFAQDTALFQRFDNVDKALKQMLIASVDEIFIKSLRNQYVGYGNQTTKQLLSHLYTTYADITVGQLQANDAAMKQPYDVNQPMETLFEQIESAVEYAAAANTPYTPQQVLVTALQLVFQTGIYADDCKEWKRMLPGEKTWITFKVFFAAANQEYRESHATTTANAFQAETQGSFQQDTIDAIANLATATASDRATVATLSKTVDTLTNELATSTQELVSALKKVTALTNSVEYWKAKSNTGRSGGGDRNNRLLTHYCWTCGCKCNHNSRDCTLKADGHKSNATAENKQGGKTTNFRG